MRTATVDLAVADYVDSCEIYLADLDEVTRAQLRNDVREIVTEVCSELDGAPQDLVGPPLRFVTELRNAAGLPALATADVAAGRPRRATLRDRLSLLWSNRAIVWTRVLVPDLRPAWWVARGVLIAGALGMLTGAARPRWLLGLLPHWPVFGSTSLALAAIGACVYASVEAGRRHQRGVSRVVLALASVVAVVFALSLATKASDWTTGGDRANPIDGSAFAYIHPPRDIVDAAIAASRAQRQDTGFSPVRIGSDLTGEEIEVIGFPSAQDALDRLVAEVPPAAIYVDHDNMRERPGTLEALNALLDDLVRRGHLNP